MNFKLTRELIHKILSQAMAYQNARQWTLQGFGMLRLNLANVGRIHVWDDRFAVPDVSVIHTHPWSLESTVISGCLHNRRYSERPLSSVRPHPTHMRQAIATGEGGGLRGEPVPTYLIGGPTETYFPRDSYGQEADEIHESTPVRGTVTLMSRPKGAPLELAHVFWPHGQAWVSAEPRVATMDEVDCIVSEALRTWSMYP